ncbi:hypothetical protein [Mesorhizobium sp.]|uniref:hypothetical protein n=1 Tax=Mesorhizobium sp. TaxID=1871066 RepID=UPI000FE4537D|nr:hypothetical protein [Mesorhizobium sp.]RWD38432.1 MAG: hypothetical protein EOS34_03215 [Mesorhizobium sp.]RWD83819.1 MAG: hypothetical protein EOS48_09005 [Mesorhizobium sp.]RWF01696.1 MAG: hypothetical protein EOS43_09490 [Mesorhizobium sp.]TIS38691.1 MAG: hypothetical protein E5W95_16790 [Mesorhizobium sp.]TIT05472.1 MAG: hypothetical protein E5W85_29395 [Mesorhizobium sp.]
MDFNNIYQRMKFEEYEISEDERSQLTDYLKSAGSAYRLESNTAILVFCYSNEPASENVTLVRKFLAKEVVDYSRSAAVTGLYRVWKLGASADIDDLVSILALSLDESRHDTSLAAIGCAFLLMHWLNDRRLSTALMSLLETLHDEVRRENDFVVNLFIYACWSAYDNWAQRNGQRRIHFDTIEEALPIYWDRPKYLLESIN